VDPTIESVDSIGLRVVRVIANLRYESQQLSAPHRTANTRSVDRNRSADGLEHVGLCDTVETHIGHQSGQYALRVGLGIVESVTL
jgi:hypothetical protein